MTESAPDPQLLASAQDAVNALMRAFKTLRLYEAGNPVYQKVLKDVTERFLTHVTTHGALCLRVEPGRIHLDGHTLHQDEERNDSLPFRLFSDGIRAIHLREGLTREEMASAIMILARGTTLQGTDDDTVTLLWGAGLANIDLEVVEESRDAKGLLPALSRHHLPELSEAVQRARRSVSPKPSTPVPDAETLRAFALTPADRAHIRELIRRETEQDPVMDLLGILKDIMTIAVDDAEFIEAVGLFTDLLVGFLSRGKLAVALRQVDVLATFARMERMPEQRIKALSEVLDGLGSGRFLAALRDGMSFVFAESATPPGLSPAQQAAAEDLKAYLAHLRRTDAEAMLSLAADVPNPSAREAFCETVARLAKGESRPPLLDLLSHKNAVVVQCALRTLSQIGDAAALPAIILLSNHPDVGVRRVALDAIGRIVRGADAHVLPFLVDRESRVRRRALALVESSGFTGAVEALKDIVARPDFTTWELTERRAVFAGIGTLLKDDAIGFFEGFLGRRNLFLFGNRKDEDNAVCAVAGLRAVGTPAAVVVLSRSLKHRSQRVRDACEWVLKELKEAQ